MQYYSNNNNNGDIFFLFLWKTSTGMMINADKYCSICTQLTLTLDDSDSDFILDLVGLDDFFQLSNTKIGH